MFQFCFRNFTRKCFSRALNHAFFVSRWNFLGRNIFSCDQNTFFIYSFGDNSLAVLSELHSDCPAQRLDGNNFSKGIWCIFFCDTWQEIFLTVQSKLLSTCLEELCQENHFSEKHFSNFWREDFHHGWLNFCVGDKVFLRTFLWKDYKLRRFWNYSRKTLEIFFEHFSAGLSKLHFTCPESRETFKDFFQENFFVSFLQTFLESFLERLVEHFRKKCQKLFQRHLRSSLIIF